VWNLVNRSASSNPWTISNTRPRFNSSQGSQFSFGESGGNYLHNSKLQCSTQQFQYSSQQTPHVASNHQDRSGAPMRKNLQFTLMVVSTVENWGIMPASAKIVTFRLPRKTMDRGSDNHHLRYIMEVQILRSTRVNGIMCVTE
jgi:hypothetical protein